MASMNRALVPTQLEADPFSDQIFADVSVIESNCCGGMTTVCVSFANLQTVGKSVLRLAVSNQRSRVADGCAVVDTVGRH